MKAWGGLAVVVVLGIVLALSLARAASYGDKTFGWECPHCGFWTMDFTELERHEHSTVVENEYEKLVWSRVLTPEELREVHEYLETKYGTEDE